MWLTVLQYCVPIIVALVGIIPTIIENRKKTEQSINALRIELKNDTEGTNKKVDDLKKEFTTHKEDGEEYKAKQARMRILRFYDELCEGQEHSESYFEDILDDCEFYENFCKEHNDFKNHRGQAAIDHIDETYRKLKKSGKFLTHEVRNAC